MTFPIGRHAIAVVMSACREHSTQYVVVWTKGREEEGHAQWKFTSGPQRPLAVMSGFTGAEQLAHPSSASDTQRPTFVQMGWAFNSSESHRLYLGPTQYIYIIISFRSESDYINSFQVSFRAPLLIIAHPTLALQIYFLRPCFQALTLEILLFRSHRRHSRSL